LVGGRSVDRVVKKSTGVRIFGLCRVAVGSFIALAPARAGEMWFGDAGDASTMALLRSVGARDVGLGLGVAMSPQAASPLLAIGVVADVADAVAAILERDRLPGQKVRSALTGAALFAVIGAAIRHSDVSARSSREGG
jgi:hypothetical protein